MRNSSNADHLSLTLLNNPRQLMVGILLATVGSISALYAVAQESNTAATGTVSALIITTDPNAIIWIDEVRRGTTDASGKLALTKVSPGRHTMRVRANGFKETTTALLPGRRTVTVKLLPTTDKAELLFQRAETTREQAKNDADKGKAADLYREAIKLRTSFPAAHVGLARVLLDLNQFKEARAEIDAARRTNPS